LQRSPPCSWRVAARHGSLSSTSLEGRIAASCCFAAPWQAFGIEAIERKQMFHAFGATR
jgi:hypothetical protein